MARPLRIEFEGAVYHVTSRGNAREDIFLSDTDREMFLKTLAYVGDRFGWICHAYCLMGNHYHLMIETPQANLSRGMRQLNGIYTQRFNREHHRVGHVFQGRFKSILVEKDAYLLELSRYIVRNPVAAGMVNDVAAWPWSSYRATAGDISAPGFLRVDWLLSQFGESRAKAQAEYTSFVHHDDMDSPWDGLNGPDVLGSDEFRGGLPPQNSVSNQEIPRKKRILRHLPLSQIAAAHKEQTDWMREAYREHGYTMQAIADHAGLHLPTVSRWLKKGDRNARNKT